MRSFYFRCRINFIADVFRVNLNESIQQRFLSFSRANPNDIDVLGSPLITVEIHGMSADYNEWHPIAAQQYKEFLLIRHCDPEPQRHAPKVTPQKMCVPLRGPPHFRFCRLLKFCHIAHPLFGRLLQCQPAPEPIPDRQLFSDVVHHPPILPPNPIAVVTFPHPTMPPTPTGYAINLQNVTKVYRRRVHALQGISMQVNRGEIFGLLGPNGAGKSTLVKIMVTVVRPTSAHGTILDRPIGHKATLRSVGYLPENHRFPKYLTGRQVIEFFSSLANAPRSARRHRAVELLDQVGMTAWADTKISQYSKGMLQRIGLAQAMGANPDLIILDEPTDGVDPGGRRDIREVLLQLRGRGATIFINSHLLTELESVCDRVAILVGGRVARQGSVDELTATRQFYLFELETPAWSAVASAFPGAFDGHPASRRPTDAREAFRSKLV